LLENKRKIRYKERILETFPSHMMTPFSIGRKFHQKTALHLSTNQRFDTLAGDPEATLFLRPRLTPDCILPPSALKCRICLADWKNDRETWRNPGLESAWKCETPSERKTEGRVRLPSAAPIAFLFPLYTVVPFLDPGRPAAEESGRVGRTERRERREKETRRGRHLHTPTDSCLDDPPNSPIRALDGKPPHPHLAVTPPESPQA
jgi:hypothetical protein